MKIKRIFITLCAACAVSMASFAQTARQVLDQTATKLKNSGGIEATFEGTQFKGTHEAGTDGKGIYQFFENSRFIHSPKLTNIDSPIRAILQEDKTVWIGSKGNGLSRYQMVNEDSTLLS